MDYVTKLVPLWKKADEVQQMETKEGNVASTDSGFGLKVSTMKLGYFPHFLLIVAMRRTGRRGMTCLPTWARRTRRRC